MAPSRRRSRSMKLVAATTLLALAAVVAGAALTTAAVPALAGATVLSVIAGIAAALLMFAEIVVMRRMWAFDRAQMADGYRIDTLRRHDSELAFVQSIGSRLAWHENQLGMMQDALLTSEIEIALARERLSAEKGRVTALESDAEAAATDLASARVDLLSAQDALVSSESAEVAARAEIIAWQEVAEAASRPGQRRLA